MNAPSGDKRTVLHYVGYDDDRGGIVSVVRALAGAERFACVLGVNQGFQPRRTPPLVTLELPALAGETLGVRTFWRSRAVARELRAWLAAEPGRVFHGHSRAGLAVALWLARVGERRVVASVHCYGKQKWFYRWAAHRLGHRLFWLTPAMKQYYRVADGLTWAQCIPGCVPGGASARARRARDGVVRLGGVGALVPWKRWHLVLDALARLPSAVRAKLRFTHIGGAEPSDESERYAAALRAQTEALGLNNIVEWRGPQPSAGALLAESDCLAVASHCEPFSVAMLEALAAGVPVLAADSGGARDVIVPPRNGWFFRSGDPDDLARVLAMLAESDALTLARVAPEQLRPFTAAVVAEQWAGIYSRLEPSGDQ
jgi:glycosyltransferase involved in cell wall biosynthesis